MIVKHKFREKYIANFREKILQNTNKLWLPLHVELHDNKINSCFDFHSYMNNDIQVSEFECDADVPQINDKLFKSVSVFAHPNSWQKLVLSRWFDAYILMFNETIKYIKNKLNSTKLHTLREMNLKVAKLGKQVKEANNLVKTLEKDKTKIQKSLVRLKTKKKSKLARKLNLWRTKKPRKSNLRIKTNKIIRTKFSN
jgi:hypothetical protein